MFFVRKIPIFLRLKYDYPRYIAHTLKISHSFPNLLSYFKFFQNLSREIELRIMVNGDGKYFLQGV